MKGFQQDGETQKLAVISKGPRKPENTMLKKTWMYGILSKSSRTSDLNTGLFSKSHDLYFQVTPGLFFQKITKKANGMEWWRCDGERTRHSNSTTAVEVQFSNNYVMVQPSLLGGAGVRRGTVPLFPSIRRETGGAQTKNKRSRFQVTGCSGIARNEVFSDNGINNKRIKDRNSTDMIVQLGSGPYLCATAVSLLTDKRNKEERGRWLQDSRQDSPRQGSRIFNLSNF
ncbi:hypothetical protein V8F33_003414 [Rhypophila sp. PSN 637]